jgi:quercetin dioxygenase-like cupin family protein
VTLPYIAHAADHQHLEWIGGGIMSVLLDAATTDGSMAVLRTQLPAGSASPVHAHQEEDEVFVMISGQAVFWVGADRHEVRAGGVVFIPRGLVHGYHFVAPVSEFVTICTPAGVEAFFRAAGWDLSQPRPEGWVVTAEAMAAAAEAGHLTMIGPPLGAHDEMPAAYLGDRGER